MPDLSGKSLPDFDLDFPLLGGLDHTVAEVSPPEIISALKAQLSSSDPVVKILEPEAQSTLKETNVSLKLSISGLKLFKDPEVGLGPHIALIVDENPAIDVYDVNHPIDLKGLRPGTHTVRAIAEYPWHESFKNSTAYAQTSFNVLTPSRANDPGKSVILTTSSLESTYTTEPMMLDFVVRGIESDARSSSVKVTLNDQSFTIAEPDANVYLTGLQNGQNWLKLELLDRQGKLALTPFSEQFFGFTFQPDQTSALGQLLSEKTTLAEAGVIVGLAKPTPSKPELPKSELPKSEPLRSSEAEPSAATLTISGDSSTKLAPKSATSPTTGSSQPRQSRSSAPVTATPPRSTKTVSPAPVTLPSTPTKDHNPTSPPSPPQVMPKAANNIDVKVDQAKTQADNGTSQARSPQQESPDRSSPDQPQEKVSQGLKNWRDRFRQLKAEANSQSSRLALDSSETTKQHAIESTAPVKSTDKTVSEPSNTPNPTTTPLNSKN